MDYKKLLKIYAHLELASKQIDTIVRKYNSYKNGKDIPEDGIEEMCKANINNAYLTFRNMMVEDKT